MNDILYGILVIVGIILFIVSLKSMIISRIFSIIAFTGYLICIITESDKIILFYILSMLYCFSPMLWETFEMDRDYYPEDIDDIPDDFDPKEVREDWGGRPFIRGKINVPGIGYVLGIGGFLAIFAFNDEFIWIRYVISILGIVVNGIITFVYFWAKRRGV